MGACSERSTTHINTLREQNAQKYDIHDTLREQNAEQYDSNKHNAWAKCGTERRK